MSIDNSSEHHQFLRVDKITRAVVNRSSQRRTLSSGCIMVQWQAMYATSAAQQQEDTGTAYVHGTEFCANEKTDI